MSSHKIFYKKPHNTYWDFETLGILDYCNLLLTDGKPGYPFYPVYGDKVYILNNACNKAHDVDVNIDNQSLKQRIMLASISKP